MDLNADLSGKGCNIRIDKEYNNPNLFNAFQKWGYNVVGSIQKERKLLLLSSRICAKVK